MRHWQVRVPDDLDNWFESHYPFGSKTWFIESCLQRLRDLHEHGKVETPVQIVDMVARDVGESTT